MRSRREHKQNMEQIEQIDGGTEIIRSEFVDGKTSDMISCGKKHRKLFDGGEKNFMMRKEIQK